MPKIKYGARFTRERLILYTAIAVSFICIATCNATSSWLKKDWLKDDVFGDEYHGLWKVCYDRSNRGLLSSCFERVGDAYLNNVRSGMCLSFLLYAVILGYLISMQFRSDLQLTPVGLCLIVSSLSALFSLTLFIATQDIPRVHWLFTIKYGYSFGLGWFGMLSSIITGVVCISLPKVE